MLKSHYTCLLWDSGDTQYIIDMDNIKGVRFQPAKDGTRATVQLDMGEGVTYCMDGETAETFADWYWRTHGEGGYRVPDLDIP